MMTRHPVRNYDTVSHPLRREFRFTTKPIFSREPLGDFQLFVMTFAAGFLAFYGFMS